MVKINLRYLRVLSQATLPEPSFQILHAFQILERTLIQFKQRFAEFEIVFWKGSYFSKSLAHITCLTEWPANCHATLKTGGTPFIVASRTLARALLFEHLLKLDVVVHVFNDLDDPLWANYEAAKKVHQFKHIYIQAV
jgi:hypothetical protein